MPVKMFSKKKPSATASDLKRRLVTEWKRRSSSADQPIILEERERRNRLTHVYVVWDDWAGLTQLERSEIIMEALDERYGRDKSMDVRVAMGLLPVEADRFGIEYRN